MSVLAYIRRFFLSFAKRFWHGLREWALDSVARIRHRGSKELIVTFDNEGFRITRYGRLRQAMFWRDLTKVRFEQYDTSIEVIYYFYGDDNDQWLNFYEFCEGRKEFEAAVDERWPGYARVAEDFGRYAWGRSNSIPHLQLELTPGQTLSTPEEWFSQVPTYAKDPPIWQIWKWFS